MDLFTHWEDIRTLCNQGAPYCTLATVAEDGAPHVTPIGSLFLTAPGRGFYFEKYPSAMPRHFAANPRVSILALRFSAPGFTLAMARGRFAALPGVRLQATAGERREATPEETAMFARRVRPFRWFRGHGLLWSDLRQVRDLAVHAAEGLNLGAMTYRPPEAGR